ncbi:MAG: succinate dehydrogenase, cytochrome b556 subunit [Hyphomicrobiales bacterium]|nr:succinate dehydrogenase, cytochrome b556 subunit [Hyphomicrobiales bacterium]MCP5372118.1 succinate dehydrogenase, cytochrome b556 subunit [Hyphomicrobiales bacterium]
MKAGNRPLSPHLEAYRMLPNMVLSITHRFTGVGLGVGALFLTYWLTAAAYGPEAFARAQSLMGSWFGILCLLGFSGCLFYHLCNGVRHLIWDTGRLLSKEELKFSAFVTVGAAGALTLITWIAGFAMGGG